MYCTEIIENLIFVLDKIGLTYYDDPNLYGYNSKVLFTNKDIRILAMLHGGNNEDI